MGFRSAEGHILPFPIDCDGRPYNTLTLPRERVIMWKKRRQPESDAPVEITPLTIELGLQLGLQLRLTRLGVCEPVNNRRKTPV